MRTATITHAPACQKATTAFESLIKQTHEAHAELGRQARMLEAIPTAGYDPDDAAERLIKAKERTDRAEAEYQRLSAETRAADQSVKDTHRRECLGQPDPVPTTEPAARLANPAPTPLTDLQTALAVGRVVSREYHEHALAYAVERVERAASAREYKLRTLLDLANADRVSKVIRTVAEIPRSQSTKHDADCWRRHAGCLARRVLDLLDGTEVEL